MDDVKQAARMPIEKAAAQESLTIPKHRFDCVNLCLKETKQILHGKMLEADESKARIATLERALLEAKVETALALHKARNLTAVKALIDFSDIKLGQDGTVPELEAQILRIKESQKFLFENDESVTYVLVPVKSGDPLSKSITSYIKKNGRAEK